MTGDSVAPATVLLRRQCCSGDSVAPVADIENDFAGLCVYGNHEALDSTLFDFLFLHHISR